MPFDYSPFLSPYFIAPTAVAAAAIVCSFKAFASGRKDRAELGDFRKAHASLSELARSIEICKSQHRALGQELNFLKSSVSTYGGLSLAARSGTYTPSYTLPDCPSYKKALTENREAQKALVKDFAAISYFSGADTSEKKLGIPMLALRSFNIEIDNIIARATATNYSDSLRKIQRTFDLTNKHLESLSMGVSLEFLQLKNKELQLVFEFACLKAKEADERRAEKEKLAAEAREAQELRSEIQEAEAEFDHNQSELKAAEDELGMSPGTQTLIQQIAALRELVQGSAERKDRAQSMAQKTRAGYVYIISNIGSFGENMFKVGMTRRLNPMNRVLELGDAAVPFTFDVHAFIFSDDAPALETALHNELKQFAVNKVNFKKEFFYTDLENIIAAVHKHHGDFMINRAATALEYRQSLALAYPGDYQMPTMDAPELPFIDFVSA